MTSERSEALWDLVHESSGIEERNRASSMLVKRLRKHLANTESITSSMSHLSEAIEHMIVESRMEVGRAKEAGVGMKVILEEMRRLGKEAGRLNKDVKAKIGRVETDLDEILDLLEEDRREARAGGRVARRAENSLERIDRDLSDVEDRTNLLVEMAVGQSEIETHVAGQLTELTELIQITTRVALEQRRIVEDFMNQGDNAGVIVTEET